VPEVTGGEVAHALCDYGASNLEGNGVVQQGVITRVSDITDGISNTILIGDKRLNLTLLGLGAPDDNEGYAAGWDEDTIRGAATPPAPDITSGADTSDQMFGSSHPGYINMVFCRWLRENDQLFGNGNCFREARQYQRWTVRRS
jgi:hypothetical protein